MPDRKVSRNGYYFDHFILERKISNNKKGSGPKFLFFFIRWKVITSNKTSILRWRNQFLFFRKTIKPFSLNFFCCSIDKGIFSFHYFLSVYLVNKKKSFGRINEIKKIPHNPVSVVEQIGIFNSHILCERWIKGNVSIWHKRA